MSIYIWNSEIKNVYIWTTPVKEVYVWTTKVRPTFTPRTFTITWTEWSNMSSGWTYSDDAAWLTAWSGDFDDFFWYSAVLLNTSGVETAEMKQSWWVFTGAMTTLGNITSWDNVMIKFPVRWIKMSKSWSVVTLSITEDTNKDWYQYYAFNRDWTIVDNMYLWAYYWYASSNVMKSWSGRTPTWWKIDNIRTYCTASWSHYQMMCVWQRMLLSAYYMMKYWNPNSRSVIGTWLNNTSYASTWWLDSITSATWVNSNRIKLFWIEDCWGNWNGWEWLDWIYGYYVNTSNNASSIASRNTSDGKWTLPWWTTYVWWYIKAVMATNTWMFLPTTSWWSTSTFYCDNFDYWGNCYTAWKASNFTWVFNINQWYSPTWSYSIAWRLMYL